MLALGSALAPTHVGETGVDYGRYKDGRGISCCDSRDCRPADDFADTQVNGSPVVRLLLDGAWISVPRYFVVAEDASDGRAHWCGKMLRVGVTAERTRLTACIILPPRQT
jgi:hypothetical protein